uniref:Transmembrane protein n=1 Tax=Glossina austeni TaxID=7395 RepID=A0A1A9VHX2_GLOAU
MKIPSKGHQDLKINSLIYAIPLLFLYLNLFLLLSYRILLLALPSPHQRPRIHEAKTRDDFGSSQILHSSGEEVTVVAPLRCGRSVSTSVRRVLSIVGGRLLRSQFLGRNSWLWLVCWLSLVGVVLVMIDVNVNDVETVLVIVLNVVHGSERLPLRWGRVAPGSMTARHDCNDEFGSRAGVHYGNDSSVYDDDGYAASVLFEVPYNFCVVSNLGLKEIITSNNFCLNAMTRNDIN